MNCIGKLEEKVKNGKVAVGTYIALGEGTTTEILGNAGFDFLWVDMEHTQIDKSRLLSHIIGAQAAGKPVFVRLEWNDPVLAKPVLDMGIDAVIFPMIMNKEEAEKAVRACCYPPDGIRGYGPTRANMYGLMDTQKYIKNSESSFWKILQIEHIEAIRNIDEILEVEGFDSILIGPSDLSGSLGMLQQLSEPAVKEQFDRLTKVLDEHNIPFGVAIGYDPKTIREWIERGASWFAIESDAGLLAKGARNTMDCMEEILAEYGKI